MHTKYVVLLCSLAAAAGYAAALAAALAVCAVAA